MTVATIENSQALMPTMTAEEAGEYHKALREGVAETHLRIYLMDKQQGYAYFADENGRHYANIQEYAEDQLEISQKTVYDWLKQVEVSMDAKGWTIDDLSKIVASRKKRDKDTLLPTTITRKLALLPYPGMRAQAYKTMEELKGSSTMTRNEYDAEWAKLTRNLLVDAGLQGKPGRPKNSEKNGSESTETVQSPSKTPDAPSAPPTVTTTYHSTNGEVLSEPVTPPNFDFDADVAAAATSAHNLITATDEIVQDLHAKAESMGFQLESIKAKFDCGEPMAYEGMEVSGSGMRLWFKLSEEISVCADLTDDDYRAICKEMDGA